jgi:glycerophosphoryl diester phosphodiesterase
VSKPLNIAHRGGAGLRPENTLAAFTHALDIGVDGFELDVHVAKDGTTPTGGGSTERRP